MKTTFQKIIDREMPAKIEHEDDRCIVIHDVWPQAPLHLLIIPKRLIARVDDTTADDEALLGHLIVTAGAMAKKLGITHGYRLVINCGPHAGESVPHLHVHMLARREMAWPPG